jgi:crotonobetainyl-CoA:carnitine CoA-transferase CaiB-like acyl-CoA transferase
MSQEELPYSGIKVYDATQGVAGPHCTMLLALHGAEVIKVEPPEGDWGRALGKRFDDQCAHSIAFNRGKKSVVIDLKNPEGKALAQKLAYSADVVVESFRAGVMKRLGLGYDEISAKNPGVVYASVTGFGQSGPRRDTQTVDGLIQAFSGFMHMNRNAQGVPQRNAMIIVDVVTGLYTFQAVQAALARKFRFGKGGYIDSSLMQSFGALQAAKVIEHHLEQGNPQPLYYPAGMMKTADGFVMISSMRDHHYAATMEAVGRPDLITDPRYDTRQKRVDNRGELNKVLEAAFLTRTTAEWENILAAKGVLQMRVNSYDDFLNDAHVKETGAVAWLDHDRTGSIPVINIPGIPNPPPGSHFAHAPRLGEHTDEVLKGAGLSADRIGKLRAQGAIG